MEKSNCSDIDKLLLKSKHCLSIGKSQNVLSMVKLTNWYNLLESIPLSTSEIGKLCRNQ